MNHSVMHLIGKLTDLSPGEAKEKLNLIPTLHDFLSSTSIEEVISCYNVSNAVNEHSLSSLIDLIILRDTDSIIVHDFIQEIATSYNQTHSRTKNLFEEAVSNMHQ